MLDRFKVIGKIVSNNLWGREITQKGMRRRIKEKAVLITKHIWYSN